MIACARAKYDQKSMTPKALYIDGFDKHIGFSPTLLAWRRFRQNRLAVVAGALLLLLILIALSAGLIAQHLTRYSYREQDLQHILAAPSNKHLLGTDELGRDLLTRTVYGARTSLGIGFLAVGLALCLGTFVGAVTGYFGGWIDAVLMRIVDVWLSLPSIFVLILVSTLFEPNFFVLPVVLAIFTWLDLARLIRGEVLSRHTSDYVQAAQAIGASPLRIILYHIIPNTVSVIITWTTLALGDIILIESALSYLGFGVPPPMPSWGNMLSNAQQYFYYSKSLPGTDLVIPGFPLVLVPGACIFLTVICTNLLGNGLRDAFDPRAS